MPPLRHRNVSLSCQPFMNSAQYIRLRRRIV